ncbi:hypothetical protein CU633_07885 [Bacillus sp. V3-13]|uniref:ABC transporter permease subunit n=1 Tax=Bacillus sp. V3-13 TaxID=2053728 RepID=UPI000C774369|nr:ABC transporter permease subunit [Bacillus sp. V3-13]PLR77939.1 hypothetical protein CU633_07885 [Bacillus sp. V3-13]
MRFVIGLTKNLIILCLAFVGLVLLIGGIVDTNFSSVSKFFVGTLRSIMEWDFGTTYYGVDATEEAELHFVRSLKLIIPAFFISMIFGITKGIFMFISRNSKLRLVWILNRLLFGSLPDFFIFISVQYLLWVLMRYGFPKLDLMGFEHWYNLIFPTIVLSIYPVVFISNITYKSLVGELPKDYVRTAYSKGTKEFYVITKHLLWNSWASILSYTQTIMLYIITSLPVIELIAYYKGAGYLMYDMINRGSTNVILPLCLMFLLLMFISILISDIIKTFLVPTAIENEMIDKTLVKRRKLTLPAFSLPKVKFKLRKLSFPKMEISMNPFVYVKKIIRLIKDYPTLGIGSFMMMIIIFLAVFGPILPNVDSSMDKVNDLFNENGEILIFPVEPSKDYPFGSNREGADMFSMLILGTKETMLQILIITLIRYAIAIPLGYLASFNQAASSISTWINGILSFFPSIIIIALLSRTEALLYNENRLYWMILIIAVMEVGRVSEIFKQEFIQIRKNEFIYSAIAAGTSPFNLLKRHYLPNLYQKLIYNFVTDMSRVLFICGLLGFLSIYMEQIIYRLDTGGVDYINTSMSWPFFLGNYLQDIRSAIWIPFYTSLFMTFAILALNIFAEGLQTYFDAKFRKRNNKIVELKNQSHSLKLEESEMKSRLV